MAVDPLSDFSRITALSMPSTCLLLSNKWLSNWQRRQFSTTRKRPGNEDLWLLKTVFQTSDHGFKLCYVHVVLGERLNRKEWKKVRKNSQKNEVWFENWNRILLIIWVDAVFLNTSLSHQKDFAKKLVRLVEIIRVLLQACLFLATGWYLRLLNGRLVKI